MFAFLKCTQCTSPCASQRDTLTYTVCHFLMSFCFYCSSNLDKASFFRPADPADLKCIHSKLANLCLVTFLTPFGKCDDEKIVVTLLSLRWLFPLFFTSYVQCPHGFLTNWFLTMWISVSQRCLTCTFIYFHHSMPSKMPYISRAIAVYSIFWLFDWPHTQLLTHCTLLTVMYTC